MELDNSWIIVKMFYKGKEVYPHDLTPSRMTFKIVGYEDYQTLYFRDSTMVVPGFASEQLTLKYTVYGDSINIDLDSTLFDNSKTSHLKSIFEDVQLTAQLNPDSVSYKILDSLRNEIMSSIRTSGTLSDQYDSSKSIYLGSFALSKNRSMGLLLLESKSSSIMLLSQPLAASTRIDELFDQGR